MEAISIEYNIYYKACMVLLICFALHKLAKFSSNTGKVHFEDLVHLLRYIRYDKNLGLGYYSNIEDVPISDLLRLASINTDK